MQIKILSFNIHKGIGWNHRPTFGEIDEKISELSPDIVFFQEILGSQVEQLTRNDCQYYCYGKNTVYTKGHFGNAIFTKFPIIFSENFDLSTYRFDKRGLLHVIIALPNASHLHLICVHLGLLKASRKMQYESIINYIQTKIPDSEPIILGGDFNDWRSHATIPLTDDLSMQEAFMLLHGAYARTFPAWKPFLKLDRIYTRGVDILEAVRMTEKAWKKTSDHIAIKVIFDL